MKIHEYQAKAILAQYNVPVPRGHVAYTVEEAEAAAKALGGSVVVKAQIHAGGRGKGGGVKVAKDAAEAAELARKIMGMTLITHQTGPEGRVVQRLLIEETLPIERELYLGIVLDRVQGKPVFMASAAGGMDIEEVAAKQPDKILKAVVDPVAGLQPYQCRELAFGLGLQEKQVAAFSKLLLNLYRLFLQRDLSLAEINPLVVTQQGELLALDGKINVDDSALYRHKDLEEWRDPAQEDAKEHKASQFGLNYVSLDGNIACMVNGAGLAMATMDLIKLHGGEPANFLDVGGGTTADKVAEAFKLILSDPKVKAILVNIFGGIVRCDLIAEGIIAAVREVGISIPVVVRLEGTNVQQGRELLKHSGLKIIASESLTEAAKLAVAAAK